MKNQFDPDFGSALEAAAAIRERKISSLELTKHTLRRIDAFQPQLNAYVYQLREEALAAAKRADEAIARGTATGVFHGVPINVKESFGVKGQPCTWGIPALKIHFTHCDNDRKIIADFQLKAEELFKKAGGEAMPGSGRVAGRALGGSIHEVGTARMSVSPRDGVLNSFCQTHDIPNLYVFGGNAFPSTGDKHPTLTMMALTARGCDRLIEQAKGKKG